MQVRQLADVIDRGGVVFSPVGIPPTNTPGVQPVAGAVLLGGWSFVETTGTTATTVEIHNGNDATGGLVVAYNLSPGQAVYDMAPGDGIHLATGLWIAVTGGGVRGGVLVART